MLRISGFVADVMCTYNRLGEGEVNRTYTENDSPRGSTGGEV